MNFLIATDMNNILKKLAFILFLLSCTSCIFKENDGCGGGNVTGVTAIVPKLIKIMPFQTIYNRGDIVTIKLEIPNENNFFGYPVNLLSKTNDFAGTLSFFGFGNLVQDNVLTIIKGAQGPYFNQFEVPIISTSGNYELEIKIKLNRLGLYSFSSGGNIIFQGEPYCNNFDVDTNYDAIYSQGKIEFTVI